MFMQEKVFAVAVRWSRRASHTVSARGMNRFSIVRLSTFGNVVKTARKLSGPSLTKALSLTKEELRKDCDNYQTRTRLGH